MWEFFQSLGIAGYLVLALVFLLAWNVKKLFKPEPKADSTDTRLIEKIENDLWDRNNLNS